MTEQGSGKKRDQGMFCYASKPRSAPFPVCKVHFLLTPDIRCPPQVLPEAQVLPRLCMCFASARVSVSADIILPISLSLWKWQATAAHHQEAFGAFLSDVSQLTELKYGM